MCSFLSGVLVWGNLNEGLSAWTYSLVYNGSYMLPETLLTMVAAVLLMHVWLRRSLTASTRKGLTHHALCSAPCPAPLPGRAFLFLQKLLQEIRKKC